MSPRPVHSALDLSKIEAAGYAPADWEESLRAYVKAELAARGGSVEEGETVKVLFLRVVQVPGCIR